MLVLVRFDRAWQVFNSGEVAAFPEATAQQLVASKVASLEPQTKSQAPAKTPRARPTRDLMRKA